MIETLIVTIVVLAATYGMAWWAHRAETDRAAFIGLYLVLGFPAVLLIVAGAAFALTGSRDGVTFLGIGLGIGLPLVPNFRHLIARATPVDPNSRIDMVGLATMFPIMAALAVLAFSTPKPNEDIGSISLAGLLVQVMLFVAMAFVLVGTNIWRTPRQAVERLGIRRPSPRAIMIAIGSVVVMLIISGFASAVTNWLQPDLIDDLEQVTKDMTADVQNPLGAVTLGLSAGIGEELLMRGALQPRFGMVLTSLFFALLHTQYGLTYVLGGLFLIGMLLGVLRNRYGTIAPIIAHALFNTIVVLAQMSS